MRRKLSYLSILIALLCSAIGKAQSFDGQPVYPFELKDTLGRVVPVSDFDGKAMVIDFWFTGCKGCVQVAEALHKEIIPAFRTDTNVVFLSVCLDVNFLQWKRSLRTGMYASNEQVNLFTMGQGAKHPFFAHYRYSGCPQMLIVAVDGSVVSTNPELPIVNSQASIDSFNKLIHQAKQKK